MLKNNDSTMLRCASPRSGTSPYQQQKSDDSGKLPLGVPPQHRHQGFIESGGNVVSGSLEARKPQRLH